MKRIETIVATPCSMLSSTKKLAHEIWVATGAEDEENEKAVVRLLRLHIEPLIDELKATEWQEAYYPFTTPDRDPYCPQCKWLKKDGHAPACPRGLLLAQWTE